MTIIVNLFQAIEALTTVPSPELALRLYLECAEVSHAMIPQEKKDQKMNYFGDPRVLFSSTKIDTSKYCFPDCGIRLL